ncbi:MAG: FAD-binding protein, partial [Actinomycetota bacterium]|nr:FAD-binding protein [Actinomycetota bacterium]
MTDTLALRQVQPVVAALARGILGEAYSPDVPSRMLELVSRLPETDRDQLLNGLRLADTRAGALALTGRAVPVSWLAAQEAEALVQRWKASKVTHLRRLAKGIIPLALTTAYGYESPEWQRIDYPGPLGPPPDEPRRLHPIEITADQEMNCDVVVVGSGAGGGCVAAGLAAAGFDVIVVEKGGYRSERDFNHLEPDATRDMYLYSVTLLSNDLGVRILSGATLGGGT